MSGYVKAVKIKEGDKIETINQCIRYRWREAIRKAIIKLFGLRLKT